MATQGLSDGSKEINWFFKAAGLALTSATTLEDVIVKMLELHKDDPVNKELARVMKHGDASLFEVEDFNEAKELREVLAKNGVDFTATAAYGEKVYVIVTNADLEKASEVVYDFNSDRSSGIFTSDFISKRSNLTAYELSGLSEEEASLYIYRCKEAKVPISVDGPSEGQYRIRFADRDSEKMDEVQKQIAVDMKGPAHSAYEKQVKWTNEYQKSIMDTIVSGRYPDDSVVRDGSAIVGIDGKRVEISKQYVTMYNGGLVSRFSRNGSEGSIQKGMQEVSQFVASMKRPVFLDRQEYNAQKVMTTSERDQFFADKEKAGFLLPQAIYKDKIIYAVQRDRSLDGMTKLHEGDMIVDSKSDMSIEVMKDEIAITTKGQAVTYQRDSMEAKEKMKECVEQMRAPVFLESAKTEEYKALEQEKQREYVKRAEVEARTFVDGRPIPTREELEALAKAEALRTAVEIRRSGEEDIVPTEKINARDAAEIFGMSTGEIESANATISSSIFVGEDSIPQTEIDEMNEHIDDYRSAHEFEETSFPDRYEEVIFDEEEHQFSEPSSNLENTLDFEDELDEMSDFDER